MPATDIGAIEAVLQTYFDGLHEGDTAKLDAARCCWPPPPWPRPRRSPRRAPGLRAPCA